MSIGIIRSGAIRSGFAQRLARARIPAIIANSRGPAHLEDLVRELDLRPRRARGKRRPERISSWSRVNWSKLPAALARISQSE